MKKAFGLLVLLFVIVLASPLGPARADDFTSGDIAVVTPSISEQDLEKYNNALQVVEYLRQGGTIDFSNVSSGYTTGDLLDEFVDLIDTVGSGIDYYGNNFLDSIFDLSSDTVQLSPNTKLKDRINQFRHNLPSYLENNPSQDIIPQPDTDYQFYIDKLTSTTIYSSNYQIFNVPIQDFQNNSLRWNWIISPCSIYTANNLNASPIVLYDVRFMTPLTINISSQVVSGKYYVTVSGGSYTPTLSFQNSNYNGAYRVYCTDSIATFGYGGIYDPPNYVKTFNSLTEAFSDLITHFRYVSVYVDGVPWAVVGQQNYNIGLGYGTYLVETNQPIEYKFDIPVYVDISDLIDKIQLAIDNKITLDFPYLNDLIVDTNGQQTIAVTVFQEDYTIDDLYVKDYGAMVPLFPLFVEYPVSLQSINNVATVGIVDVVPDEILEIFGMFLIGGLFVLICHRLME